ncbi:AMP-binding protein [Marinicella litoralis]|nr:AMP-binding protein [Marinicella litoralis]
MCAAKFESPVNRLLHWAKEKPNAVYLTQPIADQVTQYTWSQVLHEVSCVATFLGKYPQGSHIAIISLNCAHWIMADLAIQMAGHVSIPIYPTASKQTIEKILQHSEAKALFLGKMFDPNQALDLLPQGVDQLAIYQAYPGVPFWQNLVEKNQPLTQPVVNAENDLVSIIYTSGTTGDPKGVMVAYRAIQASMALVKSIIVINQQDRFVSYLPLAHVAERMAVEFGALYHGSHVSFIRSLDTFTEDVKKAAPTIFFGVPRIWTKIKMAIESKLGGAKVLNALLKTPLLGSWLKKALLKKLGFQNVRYALCAAAAINKDVLQWFEQIGLKLNEAYGMSETCGLSHMTKQSDTKTGSVGRIIEGCECRLSDAGEVLLRNPAMMEGYYKQPALTAATIDENGLLHTGDLGQIDAAGYLYITGRIKDIFKTSKGKYIAPLPIEKRFQSVLGLEHLILMGNGFTQPFLVISTFESSHADAPSELLIRCEQALNEINPTLEAQERVSHVFISHQAWSPENGLLTPTLKMIRGAIEKAYQSTAEQQMKTTSKQVILFD